MTLFFKFYRYSVSLQCNCETRKTWHLLFALANYPFVLILCCTVSTEKVTAKIIIRSGFYRHSKYDMLNRMLLELVPVDYFINGMKVNKIANCSLFKVIYLNKKLSEFPEQKSLQLSSNACFWKCNTNTE